MAVVDYTPQLKVEWYKTKVNKEMVLRDLRGLKADILDAAMWLSEKKNRRGNMVTLWLDPRKSPHQLTVEIYSRLNGDIFAKLVDYEEDWEIGRIRLHPLIV